MAMTQCTCRCCHTTFLARSADVKRGWARFCSKSCKAKDQERRTRQYSNYRGSGVERETFLEHAKEHGGIPQFNRHGQYEGSVLGPFDNTEHQNSE